MNVLFLSLFQIRDIKQRGPYPDLLREFVKHGHYVRVVSAVPGEPTQDIRREGYGILQADAPRMTQINFVRKGINSLRIGPILRRAIAKYCGDERYDLILVATPPITIAGTVAWVKCRDGARVYLLLKDIWPQGIADMGAISPSGPVYKYYRSKEEKLYALADRIGCMSQANVDYLLQQDPEIDSAKVEICPNSAEPLERTVTLERRHELREKYGIPQDKTVFLYGGNLGRPQGVPFIMDCLRACKERTDCFFLICGSGTEFPKLRAFTEAEQLPNVKVLPGLPHDDYEDMVPACDVGMIFLDYRFTIPNFPSRLLSYMQARLPVLCCTDPSTDVGDVCADNGFGWKCLSNDVSDFCVAVEKACAANRAEMGQKSYEYLLANYTAEQGYRIIMKGQEE